MKTPWTGRNAERPAAATGPTVPSPTLEAAREVLSAPARASMLAAARDRLSDLTRDDAARFVDDLAANFALWVAHLPASEEHHHAGPWGLLDHSLDVAGRALALAVESRFTEEGGSDPGREYELLPRWRYAAFAFGLLHDVGKIAQLRVETVGGEVWNPFAEPLAGFMQARSLWPPQAAQLSILWAARRGLEVHERHNSFFVGRILGPQAASYLGPVLPLILEQRSAAANTLAAVVTAADQESVRAERHARLVEAERKDPAGRPAFVRADSAVVDYFPAALAQAIERGRLSTNAPEADAFIGERYVAVRYPSALLKVMELIQERWGQDDARAKHLRTDIDGVRAFARELSFRQFLFRDRQSGTWKLKARIELAGAEDRTFLVLVKKECLSVEAFKAFAGRITLHSIVDLTPVAVDDFGVADVPGAPASAAAAPARQAAEAPPQEAPTPAESDAYIDPEALAGKIRELVAARKIAVNVAQGLCYVTPEVTYLVWPRAFAVVREAMGLPINPFEDKRPYYLALGQMPSVLKDEQGNLVASVRFRPDARNLCRVVRFDTDGLFPDRKTLEKVGFWPDEIQLVPPGERLDRGASA